MSNEIVIKQTHYANVSPSVQEVNKSLKKKPNNTSIIQLKITHHDTQQQTMDEENLPTLRVYLYLQPQEIYYIDPPNENTKYEIELLHNSQVITRLTETEPANNIIDIDAFHKAKPTFNLSIFQDNVEHISAFDDSPLLLTLYETTSINNNGNNNSTQLIQRIPKAQGFIDLLQFFLKSRSTKTIELHLHPIEMNEENLYTCRMTWHIYSLMPLLKTVHFSNCIFVAFTSIYNVHENIMAHADQLIANLSFQIRKSSSSDSSSNERFLPQKIFICSYSGFEKNIIDNQYFYYKWETLKDPKINKHKGIGISSNINVNLNRLFAKLMYPERCRINIKNIKRHEDYALICNSVHRFILTHTMHQSLYEFLCNNKYVIVLDIINAKEPNDILLQGTLDLSIFLYPEVRSCSFAIELKALKNTKQPNDLMNSTSKRHNNHNNEINDTAQQETLPLNTFAIVKICLSTPITEPPSDLNDTCSNVEQVGRAVYKHCEFQPDGSDLKYDFEYKCQEYYIRFEEVVLELAHYIQKKQIRVMEGNEGYLCDQLQNVCNSILPLISCDFNRRFTTKNSQQFANLITIAYEELCARINGLAENNIWKINRITYIEMQADIIKWINTIKLLYECGKETEIEKIADKLEKKYSRNSMYEFYIFLDHLEKGDYNYARNYLLKPPAEQEVEAHFFLHLIKIYLDYMEDLQNPNELIIANAIGNVINNLVKYCEQTRNTCQTGWLILHSAYKICSYRPGMEYARWHFDNLVGQTFLDIAYTPLSRWEILNPFNPKLHNDRDQLIWKIVKLLLTLGLYHFAEWIFREILADYLTEIERYILHTNLMIHLKLLPKDFKIIKFSNVDSPETAAILRQVNGNVRYHFDKASAEALKDYESIIHIQHLKNINLYQTALLRSAFSMLDNRKFQQALNIFEFAVYQVEQPILFQVGMGITLYYLTELYRAKACLVDCTHHTVEIPRVWGYLALINLKLSNNYEALECWKYYRIKTNDLIDDEILRELEQINYSDINLYVDDAQ